jgi:AcrR family transcriptional regulator
VARPTTPLLSREAIIDCALKIIDADGVAGLSMRTLAAELRVSGPSLYHHFGSKDAIIDAIIDRVNRQITFVADDAAWEDVLAGYAYQLRALLIAHPHIVELLALRPVTQESGLRIYEEIAARLMRLGMDPAFGREITLAVENLVYGAALMANAPDVELTTEQRAEYPALSISLLGPRRTPDDGFEVGFAALIEGLRNSMSDSTARGRV